MSRRPMLRAAMCGLTFALGLAALADAQAIRKTAPGAPAPVAAPKKPPAPVAKQSTQSGRGAVTGPLNKTVALTPGECTSLGGKIIVLQSCGALLACSTEDPNGKLRRACIDEFDS